MPNFGISGEELKGSATPEGLVRQKHAVRIYQWMRTSCENNNMLILLAQDPSNGGHPYYRC